MTEKLFYEDAFLQEFTAVVIGCEKGKNGWEVVLDRTAFYPEGGGQPADHGALGGAAVSDVRERDGVICHTCSQALEVGSEVGGRIDFDRRFDFMQQHSGEHIVSGILCFFVYRMTNNDDPDGSKAAAKKARKQQRRG